MLSFMKFALAFQSRMSCMQDGARHHLEMSMLVLLESCTFNLTMFASSSSPSDHHKVLINITLGPE